MKANFLFVQYANYICVYIAFISNATTFLVNIT